MLNTSSINNIGKSNKIPFNSSNSSFNNKQNNAGANYSNEMTTKNSNVNLVNLNNFYIK